MTRWFLGARARWSHVIGHFTVCLLVAAVAYVVPVHAFGLAVQDPWEGGVEIVLVHDTHFHGTFTRPDGVTLAHYVGVIGEILDTNPNALFVGNGDDLAPSVMSAVFFGRHMVDALNVSRLSVDTFGNHELDYGPDNLLEQVRASAFPWVSANVLDRATGTVFGKEAGVEPFRIFRLGGVAVGFTGLAPAETGAISNVGQGILVRDPADALRDVVPQMRLAGAQVVVVLAHLAWPDTEAIAASVDGVDVFLGDHAGQSLDVPRVINGAIVSRRGQEFDRVGVLTLRVRAGRIVDHEYWWVPVASSSPVSGEVQVVTGRYERDLAELLDSVIGTSAVPLDARREVVRREEAALGNLAADAMREWGSADLAIQNGGGIRGDRVYEMGPLTKANVVDWLPFQNYVAVLRLSGRQVVEALENGVSAVESGGGRFPQVSGVAFSYDPNAPPMSRVREVKIGGLPLDRDAMYTVTTNDFLAGGGDGYEVFTQAQVVVSPRDGPVLSAVVMDFVAAAGVVAPRVEGRIVVEEHGALQVP